MNDTTLLDQAELAPPTTSGSATEVHVLVLHPPDVRLIRLESGDAITVGRAADSTVVADDARVSRHHARIGRMGSKVFVRDLNSRNGTRLAEEVVRGEERPLGDGSSVRIGPIQLVVTITSPATQPVAKTEAPHEEPTADEPLGDLTPGFVVSSAPMIELLRVARRVARSSAAVLITGETGAGKEQIAEQIHHWSRGARGPFLRLNCAAVPPNLVESELFGYERGAFTGAAARKQGYLEAASGGSLLLDEVGELPLEAQAKLLRVLEARTITRVGGTREVPIDVRLLYATHRDLEADVRAGRFREDLFFRISTFALRVPPLRERPNDIVALATLFAEEAASRLGVSSPEVGPRALSRLLGHRWPGNVRELKNAIEHAVVLADGGTIGVEHLPARLGEADLNGPAGVLKGELSDIERRRVEEALNAEGGNQTRAALRLGISRRGLIRKMAKYGLNQR